MDTIFEILVDNEINCYSYTLFTGFFYNHIPFVFNLLPLIPNILLKLTGNAEIYLVNSITY